MAEKPRCEICNRNFKDKEGLNMHNSAKHSASEKKPARKTIKLNYKKIKNYGIFIAILVLVVVGFYFLFSSVKTLPPTDFKGHVEQSPPSHILKEPMPLAVQRHMLEHADGTGPPGIIINYNCKDYNCEPDLIEKLEAFALTYTSNVYVAPFKDMDAKIVLTRQNGIDILDDYDEERINNFIRGF
ncbi:MAG: hypothetical protein IIA85_03460 [Nanoarchaeota archaeon]|nr:hypothetical protein [Nanoarchaeota archaeon]